MPVTAARGCRLVLADGREIVDGTASWWTAAHGYAHPHIRARVAEQLERMPHVAFGGLANESAYTLAKRLGELVPGRLSHVFFTESGSVAAIALFRIEKLSNRVKIRTLRLHIMASPAIVVTQ